eukprot:scaffold31759_cov36-Phaeocystis_antarctica.AAC.1
MLGFERKRVVVQEPSSTVAAARLVCRSLSSWQLGAGVDVPHTGRKISRRPFSTCRSSWSNRRPSTPDPLVQKALVLVVPAGHSRLADEAGHDNEAGTVLGRHDGAVHDVEAPA